MKTKVTEAKFRSALRRVGQFFSMVALGAAILICSSASAQNLFVSGRDAGGGEIFKFTWDGGAKHLCLRIVQALGHGY